MENTVSVAMKDNVHSVVRGTKLSEFAKQFENEYVNDIILARRDGVLCELSKTIDKDCELEFLTTADKDGYRTYIRGMLFMMIRAIYTVFGKEKISKVRIEHAIGNGYYGEIDGNVELTDEAAGKVLKEMRHLVSEKVVFHKRSIPTAEAQEMFCRHKMYDKEKLFKFRRCSKTNIYNLGGFEDYFYGYMPESTEVLRYFDFFAYKDGFILLLPDIKQPNRLNGFIQREKLFATFQESNLWGKRMGIETVGDLNEVITKGEFNDIVLIQEALQEKKIAEVAGEIYKKGDVKFVMIAGPSSSGKTTFSHRLSIQLRAVGLHPHPIAVDDYFVDREKTPRDADGNYDFESLAAIDVDQFNADMTALLRGEEVELPSFNFKIGKREYKGNVKKLGKDDILVIEGIHGLNDLLSHSLPRKNKFKIYISALTQLNIDEHNRIPTTDGRLIRRIVRDARTRGSSAERTIQMWPSVRRGEQDNIFPYQEDCDVMFNSALLYELAVLKQYAEPLLFSVPVDSPAYTEAKRLLKFLDYFLGAGSDDIPQNSILREFVGGSCFKV
ncbi:MAG: nucleoside kinase [Lachnospiraceae bacterium]|nr:nucleoside kinase [Lachnospiraceae bacterium]